LQEELLPVLTVLIQCASKQRTARKCLRHRVLPPLRNVSRRPEQGEELRNTLCRLMTSSVTQVEFLVAEFLFILCKENGDFNHILKIFFLNINLDVVCHRSE